MGETDGTPRYDKRIHALVSERQHEEWKSLTRGDDAPYESMSQLVRLSVQREIADENPATGSEGGLSEELQSTILAMADTLEGIDSRLSSVEERMSKLEVESDADSYELQGQILNALPKDNERDMESVEEWASTVLDVAAQVEAEPEVVLGELELLWEETGAVERETGPEYMDGYGMYYYRRA
jgi:hypothetical protein